MLHDITRFHATTGLSDSRPEPPSGYLFPRRGWSFHLSAGSPRFLGRSVHVRYPLPPRRVRRLLAPVASPSISGFIFFGRLATLTLHNEAKQGLLALRLTCSPREASSAELLLLTLAWLLVERAINKVYSFQYTRSTRLILALQRLRRSPRNLCAAFAPLW